MTFNFGVCMGHDRSSHALEDQGRMSGYGLLRHAVGGTSILDGGSLFFSLFLGQCRGQADFSCKTLRPLQRHLIFYHVVSYRITNTNASGSCTLRTVVEFAVPCRITAGEKERFAGQITAHHDRLPGTTYPRVGNVRQISTAERFDNTHTHTAV